MAWQGSGADQISPIGEDRLVRGAERVQESAVLELEHAGRAAAFGADVKEEGFLWRPVAHPSLKV